MANMLARQVVHNRNPSSATDSTSFELSGRSHTYSTPATYSQSSNMKHHHVSVFTLLLSYKLMSIAQPPGIVYQVEESTVVTPVSCKFLPSQFQHLIFVLGHLPECQIHRRCLKPTLLVLMMKSPMIYLLFTFAASVP
jgi:hypothetical protein